ncbi:uncharacterized protein LOC113280306 [Papaver somniferum]|uniref:uncharacterized protein LOC113280306 n=1 Tax=Papaver somniferum TaxID=3469 RepID=UPI000E6F7BAF|nr:uncharacterized protein LOC113280306 [Papaver somniferum]
MKNAVQLNMISEFSINSIQISHLQYADDTLIFLNASEEEADNLVIILQIFEAITGLKVNFQKSSVISIGADNMVEAMAEILKCKVETLPLKYLGMPVGAKSRNSDIWDAVIEKFQKKVEKKLNQIMRNFLWGATSDKRKIIWVAWERACIPKETGGLGIRNLRLTNKALLAKWSWRFSKEKKQLWRRIIQEKMHTESEAIWAKHNSKPRKRNVEEYSETKRTSAKNAFVRDMIKNNTWDIKLRRNLHQPEMSQMLQMFEVLGAPPILEDEDELICTASGGFSTKTCYTWLIQQLPATPNDVPFSCIWIQYVPPKVQFFM